MKTAVITAIEGRRSVRVYKPDPIPREILEAIIAAGTWAPNGFNQQPWRFVVVESEAMRKRFIAAADAQYWSWMEKSIESSTAKRRAQLDERLGVGDPRYDPVYYNAAAFIFVIKTQPGGVLECAALCQNMMLAAHSLGIGSCWVGFGQLFKADAELVAAVGLQEGEQSLAPIVFGYPRGEVETPPRKPPVIKWL